MGCVSIRGNQTEGKNVKHLDKSKIAAVILIRSSVLKHRNKAKGLFIVPEVGASQELGSNEYLLKHSMESLNSRPSYNKIEIE